MAGPGSNLMGTRSYQTLLNAKSKRTPTAVGANPSAIGIADPSTYGGFAATVMGLQTQLAGAQALAKAGIGAARAEAMVGLQEAKAARIAGVVGAEQDAQDRGVLGSSGDLTARANAVAAAAAQRQAVLAQRASTVAGYRGQMIQNIGSFYTGLGQAQMSVANAEAMAAAERFRNDSYDSFYQNVVRKLRPGKRRALATGTGPGGYTAAGGGHQV